MKKQAESLVPDGTELYSMIAIAGAVGMAQAYRRGDDSLRPDYNQAWFEKILVDSERGSSRSLASPGRSC